MNLIQTPVFVPYILCVQGERVGSRVALDCGDVVIGRDPGISNLVLSSPLIADAHVRVWADGGRIWVQKLSYANRTYYRFRDKPEWIEIDDTVELDYGMHFRLGDDVIEFEVRHKTWWDWACQHARLIAVAAGTAIILLVLMIFVPSLLIPPQIGEFVADPAFVGPGQTATLRWSVSRGSIDIVPGIGSVSQHTGSRQVSPSQTTDYILTAHWLLSSVTRSVRVTVNRDGNPGREDKP